MAASSLNAQILKYLPLPGQEEKKSLLGVIKSFVTLKQADSEDEDFDVDEYNRDIDEAEAESERDGFISQEEMEAEFAQ